MRKLMIRAMPGRWLGAVLGLCLVAALVAGSGAVDAGRLAANEATEAAVRAALVKSVDRYFADGNYAALDAMAADLRATGARTPAGTWKLTVFYAAFHDMAARIAGSDAMGWQQLSAQLSAWQSQVSTSPSPMIVRAIALKSYAWAIRPRVFVHEASTGADASFMMALRNTRDMLDQNRSIAAKDPQFYVLRTDIGSALGEAPDVVMAVVEEGRARFPDYAPIDLSGLDYFASGSGQSAAGPDEAARVEAFANTAAEAASAAGPERYARLYWHALQAFYGTDLFRASRVNWPRLRAGFEAMTAHYPEARNVNGFAYVACLAGDRMTARQLMARIQDRPAMDVWRAQPVFAGCRRWANQRAETRR